MKSPAAITAARNARRIISESVPDAMKEWGPALEYVRAPTDRLSDALLALDEKDTPERRESVRAAAEDVRKAWLEAVRAWRAEGSRQEGVPA